jgi:hypothetical protein
MILVLTEDYVKSLQPKGWSYKGKIKWMTSLHCL